MVTWNSIITLCACEEVLELFFHMHLAILNQVKSTFTSVLSVCTDLETLQKGKHAHAYVIKKYYGSDVLVSDALITMHGKCGNISSAHQVLEKNVGKRSSLMD